MLDFAAEKRTMKGEVPEAKEDIMLGTRNVVATIAVKDLAAAQRWYEEKLGLSRVSTEGDEAVTYRAGDSKLLVYRSQFAGTNKATALNFMVGGDIDNLVKALRERGVTFEHYDMPGVNWEGDLMVAGPMKAAWFKDPDGNILCMMNG